MNNTKVLRYVAGANLLAGCLLMQGCGLFGHNSHKPAEPVPVEPQPVAVTPVEPITPPPPPSIDTAPVTAWQDFQATTPYSVRKGDTVSTIAHRYGLRWQDVMAVNPGLNPNSMRIGEVIQLPGHVDVSAARPAAKAPAARPKIAPPPKKPVPAKEVIYKVKSGDSLSLIAHRHGVKVSDIKAANGLKSDRINVNQTLRIPGATKGAATAAPVKTTPPKINSPRKSGAVIKPVTPANTKVTTKEVTTKPVEVNPEIKPVEPKQPEVKPVEPKQPEVKPVEPPPATPAPDVKKDTPAPVTEADSSTELYTVKEGDDVYAIAIRWGISPSDLRQLNNLKPGDELKPGQVLKIPPHGN